MRILTLLAVLGAMPAFAADIFIRLDTRPDIKVPVFYMKRDTATATVILLPGGAGGFGRLIGG